MSRRPKLALVAAVAVLSLAGCSQLHPGVAAEVGDDTITKEELDAFAETLCHSGLLVQSFPTAAETRRAALGIMIRTDLAQANADSQRWRVEQGQIDQVMRDAIAPTVEDVPESEREAFLDEVRDSIEGDTLVNFAAEFKVSVEGGEATDEALAETRNELITEWADEADVEVDPRFGTWSEVDVLAGSGSLSASVEPADSDSGPVLPGDRACG